jgi:hypothetical protein
MRDPPDIAALLALAAAAETKGEDASLVARAQAIAARERAAGSAPYDAIASELDALYGAGEPDRLLARLARDICDGAFDRPGAERERVGRLLQRLVLQKLRENNPAFELPKKA